MPRPLRALLTAHRALRLSFYELALRRDKEEYEDQAQEDHEFEDEEDYEFEDEDDFFNGSMEDANGASEDDALLGDFHASDGDEDEDIEDEDNYAGAPMAVNHSSETVHGNAPEGVAEEGEAGYDDWYDADDGETWYDHLEEQEEG